MPTVVHQHLLTRAGVGKGTAANSVYTVITGMWVGVHTDQQVAAIGDVGQRRISHAMHMKSGSPRIPCQAWAKKND